jgi:hypothetical protein
VRFDGRVRWVWWGSDEDGKDCVAVAGSRVLRCDSEDGTVTDLDPAQAWLRGERSAVPYAALDLWNWAGDVAYSTGQPWHDRGRIRDRCYDKLFAANVPWFFSLETYRPVWSPAQLKELRTILNRAVHVLRIGFAA